VSSVVATPKAMPVVPMLLADQKSSNNASYPKNDIHLRVNVIFYAFFAFFLAYVKKKQYLCSGILIIMRHEITKKHVRGGI
jgi:hypothetical protein